MARDPADRSPMRAFADAIAGVLREIDPAIASRVTRSGEAPAGTRRVTPPEPSSGLHSTLGSASGQVQVPGAPRRGRWLAMIGAALVGTAAAVLFGITRPSRTTRAEPSPVVVENVPAAMRPDAQLAATPPPAPPTPDSPRKSTDAAAAAHRNATPAPPVQPPIAIASRQAPVPAPPPVARGRTSSPVRACAQTLVHASPAKVIFVIAGVEHLVADGGRSRTDAPTNATVRCRGYLQAHVALTPDVAVTVSLRRDPVSPWGSIADETLGDDGLLLASRAAFAGPWEEKARALEAQRAWASAADAYLHAYREEQNGADLLEAAASMYEHFDLATARKTYEHEYRASDDPADPLAASRHATAGKKLDELDRELRGRKSGAWKIATVAAIAVGASGLALGGGIAIGEQLAANAKIDDAAHAQCTPSSPSCGRLGRDLLLQAHGDEVTRNIFLGIGGSVAIAGAVFYLIAPRAPGIRVAAARRDQPERRLPHLVGDVLMRALLALALVGCVTRVPPLSSDTTDAAVGVDGSPALLDGSVPHADGGTEPPMDRRGSMRLSATTTPPRRASTRGSRRPTPGSSCRTHPSARRPARRATSPATPARSPAIPPPATAWTSSARPGSNCDARLARPASSCKSADRTDAASCNVTREGIWQLHADHVWTHAVQLPVHGLQFVPRRRVRNLVRL